jgi:hypothetical protein
MADTTSDMKDRLNKPRVFLSHSKRDIGFVERLAGDLRKCQIEPWLDDYDIRHGQPWLTAIFEEGIPACDAIIAYLTEHSIASPVVSKEIDVGILQKLKDSSIAFLPYVGQASLRSILRPDLQTLQALEWNSANYAELLPRVVAEVWRSFLERTVAAATDKERVARLQAELRLSEMEKISNASVFDSGEAKGFEYIWSRLDRHERVVLSCIERKGNPPVETATHEFSVHVGSLLPALSDSSSYDYSKHLVERVLRTAIDSELTSVGNLPEDQRATLSVYPDIGDELLLYGFVERFYRGHESAANNGFMARFAARGPNELRFTNVLERFKYWLVVNGKMPKNIELKRISE